MAQMTSEQRDVLCAKLMRLFSQAWYPVSVSKSQLRAGIDVFDAGLEVAETSILGNVNAQVRTWLMANQTLARFVLESVAQKRREVLGG